MTKYSELLPDVLPDVPGAPRGLAIRRIRDAAIEFCRETQIWEEELDPIRIREGVLDYDIEGDQLECAEIDAIRRVERFTDNDSLRERKREAEMFPFQDYQLARDDQDAKFIIRLLASPSSTMDGRLMLLLVGLRPSRTADSINDRIFDDWYDALAHGAKFKLMQIPGKEYTNLKGAQYHEQEFQRGIAKARIELNRGKMNSNLRCANLRRFTIGGATRSGPKHPDRFYIS
jgi:hypothetical protein